MKIRLLSHCIPDVYQKINILTYTKNIYSWPALGDLGPKDMFDVCAESMKVAKFW